MPILESRRARTVLVAVFLEHVRPAKLPILGLDDCRFWSNLNPLGAAKLHLPATSIGEHHDRRHDTPV